MQSYPRIENWYLCSKGDNYYAHGDVYEYFNRCSGEHMNAGVVISAEEKDDMFIVHTVKGSFWLFIDPLEDESSMPAEFIEELEKRNEKLRQMAEMLLSVGDCMIGASALYYRSENGLITVYPEVTAWDDLVYRIGGEQLVLGIADGNHYFVCKEFIQRGGCLYEVVLKDGSIQKYDYASMSDIAHGAFAYEGGMLPF